MTDRDLAHAIISTTGEYRAEIRRRDDELLQVHLLRWTEEDVPGYGKVAACWAPISTDVSITDDHSRAVELATELLRSHDSQ